MKAERDKEKHFSCPSTVVILFLSALLLIVLHVQEVELKVSGAPCRGTNKRLGLGTVDSNRRKRDSKVKFKTFDVK